MKKYLWIVLVYMKYIVGIINIYILIVYSVQGLPNTHVFWLSPLYFLVWYLHTKIGKELGEE